LDFERSLLERPADEKIALLVRRNGAEQKLEMILLDAVWRKLGLRVQAVTPEEVTRTHPQLHGGLAIVDVRPDSAASKAGLQRGDILIGLHTYETVSLDNVLYVLNHPDLATFSPLKFYILRAGKVTQGSLASLD